MDVLLVEDNRTTRVLFKRLLERRGHQVRAFESAEAAWEAYQRVASPLLVVDWMLPGMTGLDLCQHIRQTPDGVYACIVIITALTGEEALHQALEAGADDYISKPVTNDQLRIRLQIAARRAADNQKRKQAEEQQRLLAAALESSVDGVLVTDAQLHAPGPRIVYANASMTRITGYDRAALLGQTPRLLQGPQTNRAVLERLKSTLQAGQPFLGETTNYTKAGIPYHVRWQITPIRDATGIVTHFVSIQRDVSNERRVEQEMMRVSDAKMQALGRDLHDSIGQYLTGMSFLAASLNRHINDTAQSTIVHHLQETLKETKQAVRQVAQGLTPPNLEQAQLAELLEDLLLRTRSTSTIRCTPQLDRCPLSLSVFTKLHLYRIAQEAVTNASQHSGASQLWVRLSYGVANHITLEVEDNGQGLSDLEKQEGLGFRTMQYRARTINASLQILSPTKHGSGTCIRCVVALPPDVST